MIDNPLPDQVMEEKEALYVNEQFEEHCADTAKEKFNKEGGFYHPPVGESEDVDGSHQIEEVEFIEEVEEWKKDMNYLLII